MNIGFPESYTISHDVKQDQAILVIKEKYSPDLKNQEYHILKVITDYTPYVCEMKNDKFLYNYMEQFVVPQYFFSENNGKFWCSLYFISANFDEFLATGSASGINYPILYEKDENGITIENKNNGIK